MKTELKNIGAWGRMHYDFLYRNQRSVINAMRLKGTLHDYLMGIDKDAENMFNLIVKQTAENEGITERLKVSGQMEWIRRMHHLKYVSTLTCFDFKNAKFFKFKVEEFLPLKF